MKRHCLTYKILSILSVALFMPDGMSSVWCRTPRTADTLAVQADSAGIPATHPDSLQASETVSPLPAPLRAETDTMALDTTAIGAKSDSLLSTMEISRKRFIPNPQRALWLSLIIPGAGQVYNRKLWKIPIVYGGFLGCLYALTWNNQMYNDYSQAYLDIMDDDPNTKSYMNMLPLNFNMKVREGEIQSNLSRTCVQSTCCLPQQKLLIGDRQDKCNSLHWGFLGPKLKR